MRRFFLLILLFSSFFSFSHSVQVQYCVSCGGDLRIWVEHWHSSENPNTTTMTIQVTVNGITNTYISSPGGGVMGIAAGSLPGCSTPLIYGAGCTQQNSYNDWVYYDFPGLPLNVPLSFTIISGNTAFTQDACGMYPLTVNFTINTITSLVNQNICFGDLTTAIVMDNSATWTNSNPLIGLPASGTGTIPSFTPVGPAGTTATITYSNQCSAGSFDFTTIPELTITSSMSDYNGYNVSCNGYNDGTIDLSVSGSLAGYTYLWNTLETTQDLTNLTIGTYSVVISDANAIYVLHLHLLL